MATFLTRSLFIFTAGKQATLFRSFSCLVPPHLFTPCLRLSVAPTVGHLYTAAVSTAVRGLATRQTSSSHNDPNPSLNDPNPNSPKETILFNGCDFEHWLIWMEDPSCDSTRDEIIDSYIKTLAQVVGSEEEARMKIYSVFTRHIYAFGALVSRELCYKLKELKGVLCVHPDVYLDVKDKDNGGEPFINGQAGPYEEWVRNNIARAIERNKRNDRPRNFDRSRNFERSQMPRSSSSSSSDEDMATSLSNVLGEPFINGQAVPCHSKYHEEWLRNNARVKEWVRNNAEWVRNNGRANESNRRNDRPRNFDKSRNFERRQMPRSSLEDWFTLLLKFSREPFINGLLKILREPFINVQAVPYHPKYHEEWVRNNARARETGAMTNVATLTGKKL